MVYLLQWHGGIVAVESNSNDVSMSDDDREGADT